MSNFGIKILLLLLLICTNGLFAMTEIAMVSARKVWLRKRAQEGDRSAKIALNLAESPNRLLSTVQVGITLIGILAGALGGTTLAKPLATFISNYPPLAAFSEGVALVIVVLIITYLSLVIGELIPKRLALSNPVNIAIMMARPMQALSWFVTPIVHVLSKSTNLGLRLLGIKSSREPPITEDEIKVLLKQGTLLGIFDEAEQDIITSVFRLGDRRIDAIMTPYTEIVWLDLDDPFEESLKKVLDSKRARFPVARGGLDNIQGIIMVKDLLMDVLSGNSIGLESLLQPPLFIPESMPALRVLDEIKSSGVDVGIVIDEFGGILGMVTQFDILKSIVGDIQVPGEDSEPLFYQRPDGSWLLDGLLQVDELRELLNIKDLPDEERNGFQTLGGFVMSCLGVIPKTGQTFEWDGFIFEVVDMDGRRVDKILVSPLPEVSAGSGMEKINQKNNVQ